ncbi:MAG TPA: glycine betaine ABC transporter substrate-binding protein [Candidatus Cloacimonadota bacterium]|nr:glycine betaine ABC transporter substrate-binding protein [Candidatus Cloacimonadota bacterium]
MKRLIIISLMILLVMFAVSCSKKEKIQSIKIAYGNNCYDIAVANLIQTIVSSQTDLDVELVGVHEDDIAKSLADGRADISFSLWFPHTSAEQFEAYKDSLEFLSEYFDEIKIGLAAPAFMDVNSIDQLKSKSIEGEKIIAVFDTSCVLTKSVYDCIDKYSLTDFKVKIFETESEMLTYVNEKIQKNEPVLFTSYFPHWLPSIMKVNFLTDNLKVFGENEKATIYTRKGFSKDLKQISAFLKQVKLTTTDITEMMRENEKADADSKEIANQWINDNVDRINLWINKANESQ